MGLSISSLMEPMNVPCAVRRKGSKDGWMDGWMMDDGWMDGWMDVHTYRTCTCTY